MKTLITTLNSKFIHTALALRLLYVACVDKFDIDFKEYTVKDDLNEVCEDILSMNLNVLALSTYIWNVEKIKELAKMVKQRQPDTVILLGGPEVTYEPRYFLEEFSVDYVLCGEGEKTLPSLLKAIEEKSEPQLEGICYLKDGKLMNEGIAKNCDLSEIEKLPSPYLLERDLPHIKDRIVYFESSRGCPYQCQYCLSSLEKGVRFYSDAYIHEQLSAIIQAGAKTIKFLDRSFNVNPIKALGILDFIVTHYLPGQQFQFEVNADVLDQRIIDFVNEKAPKGLLRFEVGIQSTYEPTNEVVKRKQDFQRLSEVIMQLVKGDKIDLHLDLIAGLPFESYERFKQSFDDVFAFRAKELQLGFLKLLRGTSLRKDAELYDYTYQKEAPYEIFANHVLSNEERQEIHVAEEMLEKYWNSGRFYRTMNALFDHEVRSPFEFFHDFGRYYIDHGFKMIGHQVDDLFLYLESYLKTKDIDVLEEMVLDYLELFKVKPKKWWKSEWSREERQTFTHALLEEHNLLAALHLNQELLFRYCLIERINNHYIIALYKDFQHRITVLEKVNNEYKLI